MFDINIISKNIIKLRKQKGLKQQELADKVHYSDKVISKWERGESVPDIAALVALVDFFGITLDAITKEINIEQLEDGENQNNIILQQKRNLKFLMTRIFASTAIIVIMGILFLP